MSDFNLKSILKNFEGKEENRRKREEKEGEYKESCTDITTIVQHRKRNATKRP